MEIIENTLDMGLDTFLSRPLFCFLATTDNGAPRISPLWFLWEDDAIWIIANAAKTYPSRVEQNSETALAIVDFDRTTGAVHHVGMRGQATVEPHDPARAERLLSRYLGHDKDEWDKPFFGDPYEWGDEMVMIRFDPETVVARDQSYSPSLSLISDQ
jgi:nitroimidazol reductase NimA-like FMN-containing flavoprotein (pyridoxamine 5'-phosphate oxidase superfamily)